MLIERPPIIEGTQTTGCAAWIGRNKKTIQLNLKKPQSVEAVKKLISEYDIVIEQFRPGVMKRLGLDYETLRQINPKLIYCSITGYGQTGPMAHDAGHDLNYLALSGLLSPAGQEKKRPAISNTFLGDIVGGSLDAVIGILSAVYYREKTGIGQYIDVGMMDGVVQMNSWLCAAYISTDLSGDQDDGSDGREVYDLYETADGRYMCVGAIEPKFVAELFRTLGLNEWEDGTFMKEHPAEVKRVLQDTFKTKSWEEWTKIFEGHEACVSPVLSTREMCYNEHILAREMVLDVPLPLNEGRTVRQLGNPIKLSETPARFDHAGYPEGYHTSEVLSALGYSEEDIKNMI